LNKVLILIFAISVVIITSCTSPFEKSFNDGVERLNELDSSYNVNLKSAPETTDKIDELIFQYVGFRALQTDVPQPLDYLIDFRLNFLESEKLNLEGWQWGRASTTEFGFGCKKGFARITESASLRNQSAQKGFEAVTTLTTFVDEYPEESKSLNLTQKDALFLNAYYFQVEKKALRDAAIVKSACKKQAAESVASE